MTERSEGLSHDKRPKVVITDYDYGNVDIETEILEKAGARVVALQAKREEDLFDEIADCAAVMNQYARVGAASIARMRECKVIARYGVGVDIVDVEAASDRNILVTNVRDYCTEEVADHAISLWLTLARQLFAYDRATHPGIWRWQSGAPIHRLRGQTMGIVSFGKIGQAIAERARGFGLEIVAYDPFLDVAQVAGWVAPNPGGGGPMTRAMLLTNIVQVAEQQAERAAAPMAVAGR